MHTKDVFGLEQAITLWENEQSKVKLEEHYFGNWGQIQVSNMSSGGLEEFPLHQLSSIYYTRRNFSHFVAKCEVIKGEAGAKSVRKCFPLEN